MGDRLKGKVAIVTGSGRGIGRGHALLLAAEGAKVVVNDPGVARDGSATNERPADAVVAEIKKERGVAVANYDSVATSEGAANIIKTAIDKFGRLDILINNAGILRERMSFNMTDDDWDSVIKTHLYGHFYCAREAARIFRQQRSGRIINTSSTAGLGTIGQCNYGSAKEGIIGLTRALANELGRYGVTVNCIRPGGDTRMTTSPEIEEAARKRAERVAAGTAAPRPERDADPAARDPQNNAPFVVWLCTDAAAHVNGYDFATSGYEVGLYSQPTVIKSIHKDGRWTLDELDDLAPKTVVADLFKRYRQDENVARQ
ncbi:MAG: SDR family NAD(P)-dependent oxidoreductase [Chloroflexi bacterium]|nr:SDR family NAD(P)-dependent oxidoreductase [Chloroflexota bacterium]